MGNKKYYVIILILFSSEKFILHKKFNPQPMGSEMESFILRKKLEYYIPENFVNFDEYQDKFYLMKRIKEFLPGMTDNNIYNAIDYANITVHPPRRKSDYINVLLGKLISNN